VAVICVVPEQLDPEPAHVHEAVPLAVLSSSENVRFTPVMVVVPPLSGKLPVHDACVSETVPLNVIPETVALMLQPFCAIVRVRFSV
jgi:hypothetical protein